MGAQCVYQLIFLSLDGTSSKRLDLYCTARHVPAIGARAAHSGLGGARYNEIIQCVIHSSNMVTVPLTLKSIALKTFSA